MPSSATITSFYNFSANTKARASQVNNNFDVFRGHIIPVDPNTATSINNTYDLGSSTYRWRSGYFTSLSVSNEIFPMTSTSEFSSLSLTKTIMDSTTGAIALVSGGITLTSQITINETRNIEIGLFFTNDSLASCSVSSQTTTTNAFGARVSCYRDGTTTCIGRNEIYAAANTSYKNGVALSNFKFINRSVPAGTYNYTLFYELPLFTIGTTTSLSITNFKMYARAF